jgi:Contractile injection system tube protein
MMLGVLNALTKCKILASDGTHLDCHFNPKQVTLSTGAKWETNQTPGATETPAASFKGTNPRAVGMELLFDSSWTGLGLGSLMGGGLMGGDVEDAIKTLIDWTKPSASNLPPPAPGQPASPPKLRILWGTHKGLAQFVCVLKSVSVTYTEFNPFGPATRATAKVDFEEVPGDIPPAPQNPSSGSLPGQRTHLMTAGDTLHSIAQREYGRPALWRGLAIANGIDDPLRVGPGTTILIPPREDAEILA